MKKLILPLLLVTTSFYAAGNEIVNSNDGKSIISKIKDLQVEEMLSKTSEFSDCSRDHKFVAGADEATRTASLQKAEACFQSKLGNSKNAEQLKKLSESLNLQEYNLVQSNKVKDIQKYLADKMYKSLTGVDRNNKDTKELLKSMSFKEKQHIDQRDLVEMYRIQLGKNALFEVSRFCFENLRSIDSLGKNSFAAHWADYRKDSLVELFNNGRINDTGIPKFGDKLSDPENKEAVYKEIFSSVQGDSANGVKPMGEKEMGTFFMECGGLIVPLCDSYTKNVKIEKIESKVDIDVEGNIGASACLAKQRILGYRKAMADTDKVLKEYDEMASQNKSLAENLLDRKVIELYESGQNGNASTDDLTSYSSSDMLQGATPDELAKQKADDCRKAPELANCEDFLSGGDELAQTKHNIEMEMTLKRNIEMARVRALEKDKNEQNLRDYLKENGYFKALEGDLKSLSGDYLAEMVGKAYEAKKLATLAQINSKFGKRQISKEDSRSPGVVKDRAERVFQETQEERSRLAQVVLFNNVITSYLSLNRKSSDGKTSEDAGRNINAWRKEEDDLKTAKVDPTLFQNLSKGAEGQAGIGKDDQISGFDMIDTILGKSD